MEAKRFMASRWGVGLASITFNTEFIKRGIQTLLGVVPPIPGVHSAYSVKRIMTRLPGLLESSQCTLARTIALRDVILDKGVNSRMRFDAANLDAVRHVIVLNHPHTLLLVQREPLFWVGSDVRVVIRVRHAVLANVEPKRAPRMRQWRRSASWRRVGA